MSFLPALLTFLFVGATVTSDGTITMSSGFYNESTSVMLNLGKSGLNILESFFPVLVVIAFVWGIWSLIRNRG